MSYPLDKPLPYGAGSSLAPPDPVEPDYDTCGYCYWDGPNPYSLYIVIDPECPDHGYLTKLEPMNDE